MAWRKRCIAVTWQWVVEVGMPAMLHTITTTEAVSTTVKPRLGVIRLILEPMVSMTLLPQQTMPREMPIPPQRSTPYSGVVVE